MTMGDENSRAFSPARISSKPVEVVVERKGKGGEQAEEQQAADAATAVAEEAVEEKEKGKRAVT